MKSRRVCPGYGEDTLIFRHYHPYQNQSTLKDFGWSPTTTELLDGAALDIFLDRFVVLSSDRTQSRGFLDGFDTLLVRAAPNSTLASAAKAITLGALAKSTGRAELLETVYMRHGELLKSFNASLSQEGSSISIDNFFTAVLLGLYEVSQVHTVYRRSRDSKMGARL